MVSSKSSGSASATVVLLGCLFLGAAPGLGACSKNNNISTDNSNNTTNNYNTVNNISQVLGPTGGFLENQPIQVRLDLPPGALNKDVELRLGELADPSKIPLPEGYTAVSKYVSCEPHGQTFATDVILTIGHTAGSAQGLVLLRAEPGPKPTWLQVATKDISSTQVQRQTTSLSFYVVASTGAGQGGSGGAAGSGTVITGGCGDGKKDGNEECDGTDFGIETCVSVTGDPTASGDLTCEKCTILSQTCVISSCGNGKQDADQKEDCDGDDLGGESCATVMPGTTGKLSCSPGCTFNTSECLQGGNAGAGGGAGSGAGGAPEAGAGGSAPTAGAGGMVSKCGDGMKNGAEQCDGADFGGETCGSVTGNPSATGTLSCDGSCKISTQTCSECQTPSTCPGVDTECAMRTCVSGVCGFSYSPTGKSTGTQSAGDCKRNACDGNGKIVSMPDNSDIPDDSNPCTTDSCSGGTPSYMNVPASTACGGGKVCNGAGQCL